MALLLLPSLLREDTTMLFANFKELPHPQLRILNNAIDVTDCLNASMEVVVDGVAVCTSEVLAEGMQILMANYYIFNIDYAKELKGYLTYL